MKPWIALVCGLAQEASALNNPDGASVVLSGGSAATLNARLEAAIADGCSRVLVVGLCAALDPALAAGDIVVGAALLTPGADPARFDPDWSRNLVARAGARLVNVTCAAATLVTAAQKAALRAQTKADAVDLEVGPAVACAAKRGLPCAYLRVVSDTASQDLPPAAIAAVSRSGSLDLVDMFASLAEDDEQWGAFEAMAASSTLALNVLPQAMADIGVNFGTSSG